MSVKQFRELIQNGQTTMEMVKADREVFLVARQEGDIREQEILADGIIAGLTDALAWFEQATFLALDMNRIDLHNQAREVKDRVSELLTEIRRITGS